MWLHNKSWKLTNTIVGWVGLMSANVPQPSSQVLWCNNMGSIERIIVPRLCSLCYDWRRRQPFWAVLSLICFLCRRVPIRGWPVRWWVDGWTDGAKEIATDIRANPTQTGFRNTPVAAPPRRQYTFTALWYIHLILLYYFCVSPLLEFKPSPCKKYFVMSWRVQWV